MPSNGSTFRRIKKGVDNTLYGGTWIVWALFGDSGNWGYISTTQDEMVWIVGNGSNFFNTLNGGDVAGWAWRIA